MRKCPVIFCQAKLVNQEELKRHLRTVHQWAVFVLAALLLSGCNGLHKLTDGSSTPPPDLTAPQIPQVQPNNILGYKPVSHQGWVMNNQISLNPQEPYIALWIYQGSAWERLNVPYQVNSRSIQYDQTSGFIELKGFSPTAYYFLYQYEPL